MHTFQEGDTRFHYNPDGSGDVIIQHGGDLERINIPMEHVLAFIGEFIKNEQIAQLEQQGWEKVLGVSL